MMHSLKFGAAAMVAVFGGGSFYLGAAETPAFAQATTSGATGQSVTTGTTTTGATAQPQRRVNRPRPGGAGGTDVRGGQNAGGGVAPLTVSECIERGGVVDGTAYCGTGAQRAPACVYRWTQNRPDGSQFITTNVQCLS